MIPPRSAAFALPRWSYVPGKIAEPDLEALAPVKALVPDRFNGFVPIDHPALIYGLALHDAGFFWEAHEILEAVWAAAPQGGRDRLLLRVCIQIANAALKQRLGRPRAVGRLLQEAAAELDEVLARPCTEPAGAFVHGYPVAKLRQSVGACRNTPEAGPAAIRLGPEPGQHAKKCSF